MFHRKLFWLASFLIVFAISVPAHAADDTYTTEEIVRAAEGFFGDTTEGLATAVEKAFAELGKPNAFITGEEVSGAFIVGLRYGKGELNRKSAGPRKIFWKGPSVGWDFGGNASKVFTLVYKLENDEQMFRRFPGVDGSFYFIAGVGMNFQRRDKMVLAPIRTGIGLRAGANIGYLHYDREQGWLPF